MGQSIQCDSLLAAGDTREGIKCLEAAYNKRPQEDAYEALLDGYLFVADSASAFRLARKQSQKFGAARPAYTIDYVVLAERLKKRSPGLEPVEDAVRRNPFNVRAAAQRLEKYGLRREAIDLYLLAEQVNPRVGTAFDRGQLHAQLGEYYEQYDAYLSAVDQNPGYLANVKARVLQNLSDNPLDTHNDAVKKVLYDRVRKNPKNATYEGLLIWVLRQEKSYDRAFRYLKAKGKRGELPVGQLLQLGLEATENERFDVAEEVFDELLADRAALESRGALGTVLLAAAKNYLGAGKGIGHLLKSYPLGRCKNCFEWELWSAEFQFKQTFSIENEAPLDTLLHHAAQLRQLYPRDEQQAGSYFSMGNAYLLYGYYEDALLEFARAEALYGDDERGDQARLQRAMCAFYSGDILWSKTQLEVLLASATKRIANDALENALLIAANSVEDTALEGLNLIRIPMLMEAQGLLDSALTEYNRLEKLIIAHELYDDMLYKKGRVLMKLGKWSMAEEAFRRLQKAAGDGMWKEEGHFYAARCAVNNQSDNAAELLEFYLLNYPAGLYVEQARKLYRNFAQ